MAPGDPSAVCSQYEPLAMPMAPAPAQMPGSMFGTMPQAGSMMAAAPPAPMPMGQQAPPPPQQQGVPLP
ncbi:hypothetical protein D3C83_122320 [compost metagenome]